MDRSAGLRAGAFVTDDYLPYGRQQIDDDDVAAVVDVLQSDWLTTGPAVDAFETAISERVGRHPVVAVNSGTAALHAAYAAAGVGPGTNIVTSPLTFAATATAAIHLGAEVRFADVDPTTLLIDPSRVAALVDERTMVIAPVDFAGQPADIDALRQVTEGSSAVIVADAAHSLGARDRGRPVGALADLTTLSFHPVKTVTTGEGGAVVVREARYLEAVRAFRSHGLVRDSARLAEPDEGQWHQEVQTLGLNYRMPDILAALGSSQLRKLDAFVTRRSELTQRYRTLLQDEPDLLFVDVRDGTEPAWHLCPVRVPPDRRRVLVDELRAAGIGVQVHYLPVHRHPWFQRNGYGSVRCPVAEDAYARLVSLPLYPGLTDPDQDRVVRELRRALHG